MNSFIFISGACFFLIFFFWKFSHKFKVIAPVVGVLGVVFLRAIGPVYEILLLATFINTILLSFIFAHIFKRATNKAVYVTTIPYLSYLKWVIVLLMMIFLIHNIIDIESLLDKNNKILARVINSWGILSNCAILLYYIQILSNRNGSQETYKLLSIIVAAASIMLAIFECAVLIGILPGNTQKFVLGEGGIGLANLSTNETGLFAVCLFLWNVKFIINRTMNRYMLFSLCVLNIGVLILSKSRIDIGLAGVLFVLVLYLAKTRWVLKIAVMVPLFVAFLFIGGRIFQERSAADYSQKNSSSFISTPALDIPGLEALPGSGRPIIIITYLDAFIYAAQKNLLIWVLGVGMFGLSDLYLLTPLAQHFNIIHNDCNFYPVHSDLIMIFMVSGILGATLWILHFIILLIVPKKKDSFFQTTAALIILIVFSTFDMLSYSTFSAILLYLAFVDGIRFNSIQKYMD